MAAILADGVGLGDAAAAYRVSRRGIRRCAASAIGHGTKLDCEGRILRSPVGDQPSRRRAAPTTTASG